MRYAILLILSATIFLSGCWDRKDIETRGYVLGIAIDQYPPNPQANEKTTPMEGGPKEEEKFEEMELHTGKPAYAMTIQIPILQKAETIPSGAGTGSTGGGEGSKTWEITQIGNSFISMNREMQSRTNLSLYYEHLQVIIISEDIAKRGLEDILDFFLRDPEMRRRVKVFISPGQAKSILEVRPRVEDYLSIHLAKLPINAKKTSRIVHETDLGAIILNIHNNHCFILPKVEATKDEVKSSGAAIFKKSKMVGWLSELELEAIKFIRNRYKGGVITALAPETKTGLVTLEVTKAKAKVIPIIENDQVSFLIKIDVEGDYAEDVNIHTHGEISKSFLEELEKRFATEIEKLCIETIKNVQKKYGADIFHFDHLLKTEEPAYWKKVEKQWDEIFPKVNVEVKADVDIMLIGIVR
jgi:Ger(x)C family germination protein